MPFAPQILRDEYRLLRNYEAITKGCGDSDTVYFPRNALADIQTDLFFSDLVSSGLEQLMELNFSPVNERFIEQSRCRLYSSIVFSVSAGLERSIVAGRDVVACPEQCVASEPAIGRKRSTTKALPDFSCPIGYRKEF